MKCFRGEVNTKFTDSINGIWLLEKCKEAVRVNAISPKCHRGKLDEMYFKFPRGLKVEFDKVLYVVDSLTESISIITPAKRTSTFLRSLEKLYDAFSNQTQAMKPIDIKSPLS